MKRFLLLLIFMASGQFAASSDLALSLIVPIDYLERRQFQSKTLEQVLAGSPAEMYFRGKADAYAELIAIASPYR